MFSPANFGFPDTVIAAILIVVRVPWLLLPVAYAGLMLAGYAVAAALIIRQVAPVRLVTAILTSGVICIGLLVMAAACHAAFGAFLSDYLVNSYVHTGALLFGLLTMPLTTGYLFAKRSRAALVAMVAISCITSFSDLLYLVWFLVPIAAVWAIVAAQERSGALAREGLVVLGAAILGTVIDRVIRPVGRLPSDLPASIHTWAEMIFGAPLRGDWIFTILMLLTVAMAVHGVTILLRRKPIDSASAVLLMLVGIQWTALLLPLLSGHLVYPVLFRYSLPIFVVPYIWLAVMARGGLPYARRASWMAPLVLVAGTAAWGGQGIAAAAAISQPSALATCIEANGLKAGFSDYWNAKETTFFTDYRVSVVQLDTDGSRMPIAINSRWYSEAADGSGPLGPMFIAIARLNPAAITKRFGAPDRIVPCPSTDVWLYSHPLAVPTN